MLRMKRMCKNKTFLSDLSACVSLTLLMFVWCTPSACTSHQLTPNHERAVIASDVGSMPLTRGYGQNQGDFSQSALMEIRILTLTCFYCCYRYFMSQSSEFCSHNPLCCFSTSNTKGKRIFLYRLSPETRFYECVSNSCTKIRRI
jgi:hypothetical protein